MLYILLYVFATAAGNIFLHITGLEIPDMLLIFLATTYAIIYFHAINMNQIGSTYRKLSSIKLGYVALSVLVLFMWMGSFFIPIYYTPAIFLLSFMSITAACGALVSWHSSRTSINLIKAVLLLVNLVAFYLVSACYYHGFNLLTLVALSLFTGFSGYGYMRLSAKFSKFEFSISQILAIRFWLLWLVSLIYVIKANEFAYLSVEIIWKTLIIGALTLIIPLYFSQKAIAKLGANQTSIWIGFTPFITFLCEKHFIGRDFNYTGYFSVNLILIIVFVSIFSSPLSCRLIRNYLFGRQSSLT